MPTLTTQELDDVIARSEVGAVSLDTTVFDRYGCNLGYKALRSLDQFKGTNIAVIFSEVIAGEVQAHISRDAAKTSAKVKEAINQHRKAWRRPETMDELAASAHLDGDAVKLGRTAWEGYIETISAEVILAEGSVSVTEVLDRYFNSRAPFSTRETKKHEFPDALA